MMSQNLYKKLIKYGKYGKGMATTTVSLCPFFHMSRRAISY